MAKSMWYRVYSDFFLPNRLNNWRALLEEALQSGYEVLPLGEFWRRIKQGGVPLKGKYLILRHDIDSDVPTASAMWEVERDLQIRSSYFFRLSTWDHSLISKIHYEGGEASYHFEELSTYVKAKGLYSREEVLANLREIQKVFAENLQKLRRSSGLPLSVVASHGDWVNRQLGIPNFVVLQDQAFRKEVGIELEVYDEELLGRLSAYFSDTLYPTFWLSKDPLTRVHLREGPLREPMDAIRTGVPIVLILVHPRHWRANVRENLVDDIKRAWEWFSFKFRANLRMALK